MLTNVRAKLRALISDRLKTDSEIFEYVSSLVFQLTESNVVSVTKVTINQAELDSGEDFTLETSTLKVTLNATPTVGDEIEIFETYYEKYSDNELNDYIKAALVYCNLYGETIFELEDLGSNTYAIEPTPTQKEGDLIALIAATLINPEYSKYEMDTVKITFPRTQDKETKIRKLITAVSDFTGWTGNIKLEVE